jgi:hypothetical protein
MRRALVVALVVLVIVTGLPVLMGMSGMDGMASCERCDPGFIGGMTCLAVLAGAVIVLGAVLRTPLRPRRSGTRSRLLVHLIERPPQVATA